LTDLLHALANVFVLGILVAVAATLAWFVYSICLRRLWRVRRIANIRLKRTLRER
jgi:drug/metabolite transporter (DMT)-like permease